MLVDDSDMHSSGGRPAATNKSPGAIRKTLMSPERELELPPLITRDSLMVQLETVRLNGASIMEVLQSLVQQVTNLQEEVSGLRRDNKDLKDHLTQSTSRANCCCRTGHQPVKSSAMKVSYSDVASNRLANHSMQSKQNNTSAYEALGGSSTSRASEGILPKSAVSTNSTVDASNSPTGSSTTDAPGSQPLGDGFTTVSYKKKKSAPNDAARTHKTRQPLIGVLECSIPVVKKAVRRKALFVSRFDPQVSEEDIKNSLKNLVKLSSLNCTKLKTKFSSYSSFHVSVEESDFTLINDTAIWPAGCLIAPFYGRLLPEQCCDNSKVGKTDVNISGAGGGGKISIN